MTSLLQLPAELWLQVFSFLSWRDKLRLRCTCSHFRSLVDTCPCLWRGFGLVLQNFSRFTPQFWRSLAQRQVSRVQVRSGKRKHLQQLAAWLPALQALRLDGWLEGGVADLKPFRQLRRLALTSCSAPLKSLNFLLPVRQLTQLSLCNVQLTCAAAHLAAAITQLTRLTALQLHHDGSQHVPTPGAVLPHLAELTHLSWTMITYKTLPLDFFSPAHLAGKCWFICACAGDDVTEIFAF